jgi:ELWxxDGT repeat protein
MNTTLRVTLPLLQWILSQANRMNRGVLLSFALSFQLLAQPVLVKDIWPGSEGSLERSVDNATPGEFTNVNGTLFFTANNGTNGWELWKSDGTRTGTVMVKDINPGEGSSFDKTRFSLSYGDLINVNGTLFFSASDGTSGRNFGRAMVLVREQ